MMPERWPFRTLAVLGAMLIFCFGSLFGMLIALVLSHR